MKITQEQLRQIVEKELESQLKEGVFDYLKGAGKAAGDKVADTGKSVAKAVSNKATAAKNKVNQVAGDIKTAGATSSLKADIEKTAQDAGMQIQGLIDRFTDLLARAQALRMDEEESVVKAELQALRNYQETAAAENGNPNADYSDVVSDLDTGSSSTSDEPESTPTPTAPVSKTSPKPVEMGPDKTDVTTDKGTGQSPKSVDFGNNDIPFDWSAKPKVLSNKITPKGPTTPKTVANKKPSIRTKLDRASIENAVKAAGGNIPQAAKNLGITKDQMIKALGR